MRLRLAGLALLLTTACGGPGLTTEAEWIDDVGGSFSAGWPFQRPIQVTGAGPVMQGTVEAILRHPSPDDLHIELTSPSGTRVRFTGRNAKGGDNYRYVEPLDGVEGEEGQGTWRLRIDAQDSDHPGTLYVWGLKL